MKSLADSLPLIDNRVYTPTMNPLLATTMQTFFPGHDDGDTKHIPCADGRPICGRCKLDISGRTDLSMSLDSAHAIRKARGTLLQGAMQYTVKPPVSAPDVRINLTADRALGTMDPSQLAKARESAVKAMAIAVYHTDPRVHGLLLMDAKNDDPATMDRSMKDLWDSDINGWRSQAVDRANKMATIMDGIARRGRTIR